MTKVRINYWPTFFSAAGRETWTVDWHEGITVGDVIPPVLRSRQDYVVQVNGVVAGKTCRLDVADYVDFQVRPSDLATATGPGGFIQGAGAFGAFAVFAFLGLIVGSLINKLIGKPKGLTRRGDEESQNQAFSGADNSTSEGSPIAVIYGKYLVAPQIIDTFVVTQNLPFKSTLYTLLNLGEGPHYSVAGQAADTLAETPLTEDTVPDAVVTVNDNNLKNFDGVEVHVRLGTNEQEPIRGFEFTSTPYEVGSVLDEALAVGAETNETLAFSTYNDNSPAAQLIWSTYAVSFDMTQAAESFTATLGFHNGGLYKINETTGALEEAFFRGLYRYIELDGGGSPITTGGDHGDGFVYGLPENGIFAHSQSDLAYALVGQFFDPQGYTFGSPGNCLITDGVNDYATTNSGTQILPTSWGTEPDAVTVEGWFKFDTLAAGTSVDRRAVVEWSSTAGSLEKGFSLGISRQSFDVGGGSVLWRWVPTVQYGYGNAVPGEVRPTSTAYAITAASTYYHIAFAYRRVPVGGQGRLTIYLNGQVAKTFSFSTSSLNMDGASAAIELMRSNVFVNALQGGGVKYTHGKADEVRVYERELNATEILNRYNGGAGLLGSSSTDLVAAYHFDNTSSTSTPDYGTHANTLTLTNGASTAAGGIVTTISPTPIKSSKYRVSILRWNRRLDTTLVVDQATFDILAGQVDESFSYPNTVNVGVVVRATDQLNGGQPTYKVLTYAKIVPVWDGVSDKSPNITYRWSNNPAWCALDLITNKRYGLGDIFGFSNVDLAGWLDWANYCDGFVYDGRNSIQDIHEITGTAPIAQITYDATMFPDTEHPSGFGGIRIVFRASAGYLPPQHWTVGRFVGFESLPVGGTVAVDINIGGGLQDAWEIGAINLGLGTASVDLKYDAAAYGTPWGGGGDYGTALGATDLTGTAKGMEHRFEYDAPHDTVMSAWDALLQICSVGRAVPIQDGNTIRVRYERPRSSIGLINHACCTEFKIDSFGDKVGRKNKYQVDFYDQEISYERASFPVLDPNLTPGEDIRSENITLVGITRRSQATRDALFRLAVNRFVTRTGSFRTQLEGLFYEVGDVVDLSNDLMPWGLGGRALPSSTTTSVYLDREVVLAGATTYYLQVRDNSAGQTIVGGLVADTMSTVQVTSVAGSYPLGTPITVNALSFAPEKDDPFVLYTATQQFKAQIIETTLNGALEREMRWAKYDEQVYAVDQLGTDIESATSSAISPISFPDPHEMFAAEEVSRQTSDGSYVSTIRVSWLPASRTEKIVASTRVLARLAGRGTFQLVAESVGNAAQFTPDWSAPGTALEIAVQPVNARGAAQDATRGAVRTITLAGVSLAPQPPTNLRATLDAGLATYEVDMPTQRGLTVEFRRGGWICGRYIGEGRGSFGPTANWAVGKVFARCRDSRGNYSSAISLDWDPVVNGSVLLVSPTTEQEFYGDRQWSSEWNPGEPWYDSADLTSPSHAGLVRTQLATGEWVLKFSGSNLTGTYQTSIGALLSSDPARVAEHAYVELTVEAYQVPPILVSEWQLPLDSYQAGRRTIEGPLVVLPDEPANCTVAIEVSYTDPDTNATTGWQPYRPGVFYMTAARYRFTVTRPNTDYDIYIYGFRSRVSRLPRPFFERDDTSLMVQSRIFL